MTDLLLFEDASPGVAERAQTLAASLPLISLEELTSTAALRHRFDRKYIVSWDVLELLFQQLQATHRALEIDGRRVFGYRSTYFDTDSLQLFRDDMQGRRKRFKCRSREYVDSELRFFEIKLKGPRGETLKEQVAYEQSPRIISPEACGFVRSRVRAHYGFDFDGFDFAQPLSPTLTSEYRRVTLVSDHAAERLTCDFSVHLAGDRSGSSMSSEFVILESKSARGFSTADLALRALGAKPVSHCSKYCLGIGLTRAGVKTNDVRWLYRRYFVN